MELYLLGNVSADLGLKLGEVGGNKRCAHTGIKESLERFWGRRSWSLPQKVDGSGDKKTLDLITKNPNWNTEVHGKIRYNNSFGVIKTSGFSILFPKTPRGTKRTESEVISFLSGRGP